MEQYEVFKSFYSEEEAATMLELLSDNNINAKIEKTRVIIDKLITGDDLDTSIHLKIKPADFQRASRVIDELIEKNIAAIEEDHYLYSFSNDELMETINKPDEWSNQDHILAKKILADRGVSFSENEINAKKAERLAAIAKPEKAKTSTLVISYIMAVILPVFALLLSLYMLTAKKILPDGNKVNVFDTKSRDHWLAIVIISAAMTITLFTTRIFLQVYTELFSLL